MNDERRTRRHLKLEQRRRIAERCESSGLSRSEYAKRHRLPLSSLQRWLGELHSTPREIANVVFREVAIPPPPTASLSPMWAVEIVGPDGMTVRCRREWSIEDLARLLRGRAC